MQVECVRPAPATTKEPGFTALLISDPIAYEEGHDLGEEIAEECGKRLRDRGICCNLVCSQRCSKEECFFGCKARCRLRVVQQLSIG